MSVSKFLAILMVAQTCFLQNVLSAAYSTDISSVRANILDHYDIYSRPVQNHNDTTIVHIEFIYSGFEIDEKRSLITLHLQLNLLWEDKHVKWNPLDHRNLTEVMFTKKEIWTPDLSVINNFDQSEIDHFGNTMIISFYTSDIWWIVPCKFQVHCSFDFSLWPFDSHTCSVDLASWTYHGGEIDLVISENLTELVIDNEWQTGESREWKLLESSVKRYSMLIHCCPETPLMAEIPVVGILITVNVQRKYFAHNVAITVVGLGIAKAILISFWLDPFAQERLPLTLLVLLLNSIYLQYMHRVIPNNGSTIPLSVSFFRDSLIMVTFALIWTVAIRYIAKIKRKTPLPLPDFVQTFLNSMAATVLCLNPRPQSKGQSLRKLQESSEGDGSDVSELVGEDERNTHEDWEWLARFLDRVAFFAYFITYIIFIIAFL